MLVRTVLTVIHYPFYGGPQNQALRLDAPLRSRGWRTVVVLPDEPGNAVSRLREAGVTVITMPLHRLRASLDPRRHWAFASTIGREVLALRSVIRSMDTDVVQVSGLVNPHAGIAGNRESRAVVWQLLDTRPPMTMRRALMPLVSRLSDVIMTTGREVAAVHPGAFSLEDRLVPFFPPVDTKLFVPSALLRREARARLGVPVGAPLIGTVANVTRMKGLEYLVRAAAIVRQTHPDLRVRILGASMGTQSSYERALRQAIHDEGFVEPGAFEIVDPGSRVHELLPAFDVFMLTSVPRSEGIPTVVLEAMSCGVPVVSTDVGAIRDAVISGTTGRVIGPLDVPAIARAVDDLLDSPEARDEMGSASRERAKRFFDIERCADVHAEAYETALRHVAGQR